MTRLNREIERRDRKRMEEYRAFLEQMLSVNAHPPRRWNDPTRCHFRITDWGVEKISRAAYEADQARQILAKPRPRNISEADWRMALRRKLNGDTR